MCHQDLRRFGLREGEVNTSVKFAPRIGNYYLPIGKNLHISQKPVFLSFLFSAFGQQAMMQRMWYVRHIWSSKDASVLWWDMIAAEDENVTDKNFNKLGTAMNTYGKEIAESSSSDDSSYTLKVFEY